MKKRLFTYFFILFSFCYAEQDVHQHGVANGQFLIGDTKISIQLTIPADSIVGYEHQPETNTEKEVYKDAIERLEEDGLFTFFQESRYLKRKKQIQVRLDKQDIKFEVNGKRGSVNLENDYHSSNHHHHNHHHNHHKHNESHSIQSKHIESEKRGEHDHQSHSDNEYHAEFEIDLVYDLSETNSVDLFSTALFERFPDLELLGVKLITDDKARHIKLNSSKMRYALEGD